MGEIRSVTFDRAHKLITAEMYTAIKGNTALSVQMSDSTANIYDQWPGTADIMMVDLIEKSIMLQSGEDGTVKRQYGDEERPSLQRLIDAYQKDAKSEMWNMLKGARK